MRLTVEQMTVQHQVKTCGHVPASAESLSGSETSHHVTAGSAAQGWWHHSSTSALDVPPSPGGGRTVADAWCFAWDGTLLDNMAAFAAAYRSQDVSVVSKQAFDEAFDSPALVDVIPAAATDRVVFLAEVVAEHTCPRPLVVRTAAHALYNAGVWSPGVLVFAPTGLTSRVPRYVIDALGLEPTCTGLAVGHSSMSRPGSTVRELVW